MRPFALLTAVSALAQLVNAQLRVHGPHRRATESDLSPQIDYLGHGDHLQSPLGQVRLQAADGLPPYKAGKHTLRPQDNTTCASYGESQWTGTIDVTDGHRIFFWFFDSRNDPANDPIIIWLNGGPGGSSLMGLFNECGPCWLEPDANVTVANAWAWNNNASVLFIDQPAGVGFSSVKQGSPVAQVDMDGAEDFQTFLNLFFSDVFPDRASLPIHLAAESYGGHYAPTYVNHILETRAHDGRGAFWGNISSIVLVNAVLDFTASAVGSYELFCSDYRGQVLNETACHVIREALPEVERLGRSCDMSYDGHECFAMWDFAERNIFSWYWSEIEKGGRNPYNIHLPCHNYPDCDDPNKGNFTAYLNQEHIKTALGFPSSFTFRSMFMPINDAYTDNHITWQPTTRQVAALLDAYRKPALRADIRLLVLNGNEDFLCNTPGMQWQYDSLRWSGQPDYRIAKWRDLADEGLHAEGIWKSGKDGRLVFVGVDDAGHTVPGDVREGSYRIVQRWIEGGWKVL